MRQVSLERLIERGRGRGRGGGGGRAARLRSLIQATESLVPSTRPGHVYIPYTLGANLVLYKSMRWWLGGGAELGKCSIRMQQPLRHTLVGRASPQSISRLPPRYSHSERVPATYSSSLPTSPTPRAVCSFAPHDMLQFHYQPCVATGRPAPAPVAHATLPQESRGAWVPFHGGIPGPSSRSPTGGEETSVVLNADRRVPHMCGYTAPEPLTQPEVDRCKIHPGITSGPGLPHVPEYHVYQRDRLRSGVHQERLQSTL